jgi:hypothetical protein
MVVYAETHSRPDDHGQLPDHGRDDGLQVAAGGARAADGDAGDRVARQQVA